MSWDSMIVQAAKQVTDSIRVARTVVLPRYGKILQLFNNIIAPSVMAEYIAHESSGVRWKKTKYPEFGLAMLTGKKGDDEIKRYNVHPFNPLSHIWAAQQAFEYSVPKLKETLGRGRWECLLSGEQTILLLMVRAVGGGCTRALIKKAASYRLSVVQGIGMWLSNPNADTTPFSGQQSTDLVRLRYLWCSGMVGRTQEVGIGPLPLSLFPSSTNRLTAAGPVTSCPGDFIARQDYYVAQAKAAGHMPFGPWPEGAHQ